MKDTTTKMLRGADLVLKLLEEAGVTRIFGLSGNQIMSLFDACVDSPIDILHCRHEASTVFMAESYAQLTGTVGVALVTAGGGLANSLGALYAARQSETPLLLLSGDSPRNLDGMGAFQTLDQVAMTAPVTKHSARIGSIASLAHELATALALARQGRPGPVHLALPQDVLQAAAQALPSSVAAAQSAQSASDASRLDGELAAWLSPAARPLILAGPAFTESRKAGLEQAVARSHGVPFVALESPRGLNDPARGNLAALCAEADSVVLFGKSADFMLGFAAPFAPSCKIAIVEDVEAPQQMSKALKDRDVSVFSGDLSDLARVWIEGGANTPARQSPPPREAWLERARALLAPPVLTAEGTSGGLTSARLCYAVATVIAQTGNTVLVSDGGEFGQWAQAMIATTRRVINGPAGGIGGALPQAIAASLADTQSRVVALSGDGSIGFHIGEFETAARLGSNFVLIIGNDRRWNAEHLLQMRQYGEERLYGCDLSAARYDLVAEALGAKGFHITDPDHLEERLREAFACAGPVCVNVEIEGLPAPAGGGGAAAH